MITANVINHMPDTEKWKKGESDRLLGNIGGLCG